MPWMAIYPVDSVIYPLNNQGLGIAVMETSSKELRHLPPFLIPMPLPFKYWFPLLLRNCPLVEEGKKTEDFDVINCEMFMFKMELLCMFFDLGMKEACEIMMEQPELFARNARANSSRDLWHETEFLHLSCTRNNSPRLQFSLLYAVI